MLFAHDEAPLRTLKHDCGHYFRPHITWFGDNLDVDVIEQALSVIHSCELLISVGTSAVVFPAAQFPLVAKQAGATLIEINPEPTQLSVAYDVCLRGSASQMLELVELACA